MVRTEGKASDEPSKEDLAHDIGKELQELRANVAALVASLEKYGSLGVEDLKGRAQGLSDEAIAEAARSIRDLHQKVEALHAQMERELRAHPLAWLVGALGLGLLVGLMFSHRK